MSALKLGIKILHEKNHINVLAFYLRHLLELPQSVSTLTAGKDRLFTLVI